MKKCRLHNLYAKDIPKKYSQIGVQSADKKTFENIEYILKHSFYPLCFTYKLRMTDPETKLTLVYILFATVLFGKM